jgi:hypothetical protein
MICLICEFNNVSAIELHYMIDEIIIEVLRIFKSLIICNQLVYF